MEGKESRFGILASSLFAVVTTAASCGAVNAMHDSFTALGGMVPMWLMQIGEVVFGGVGSGLYGMLLFVMLAVFIAGLMIGRTPEYLGKKIDVREMKMIALAILVTPTLVLLGTALAMMTEAGRAGCSTPDRTALAKCCTPSPRRPTTTAAPSPASARRRRSGTCCWRSACWSAASRHHSGDGDRRFAGGEENSAASPGTLATHDALFIGLLIGTVLLVGALTFIPALALGPLAEHFSLL
jgi:K+-transporting ATPase ATPase A chain